jgi:hypothetical protein
MKKVFSKLHSGHRGNFSFRRSEVDTMMNAKGEVIEGEQTRSAKQLIVESLLSLVIPIVESVYNW